MHLPQNGTTGFDPQPYQSAWTTVGKQTAGRPKLDSKDVLNSPLHFSTRSPSSALLPFLGEGSPTKIDYRKKGTLILASLLEDLVYEIGEM